MSDKILEREIEILRQVPENELLGFIDRNWQRLRDLLEEDQKRNEEIMEELAKDYSWL